MLLPTKNSLVLLFLFMFVLITTGIRAISLSRFNYIKSDERAWLISGASLIEYKKPQSWTIFWQIYPNKSSLVRDDTKMTVVTPYLDHPPLFSLLITSYAKALNLDLTAKWDWEILRRPLIIISMILILSVGYLVKIYTNNKFAILTLISMAALPSSILSARIIEPENLISLLVVLAAILCFKYKKNKNVLILFTLCAISFISPLLKLNGLTVCAAIMFYLTSKKFYREAILISAITALALTTFAAYGCYYDCKLFFSVLSAHSARPTSFWYLFTLFAKPNLGYYELNDPMVVTGLIGLIAGLSSNTKFREMIIYSLIPVFLSFLIIAPIEQYGWYKYLILPFCAFGLGYIWNELLNKNLVWIIMVAPALLVLIEGSIYLNQSWRKIVLILAILPVSIFALNNKYLNFNYYRYWVYFLFAGVTVLELLFATRILIAL